MSEVLFLKEPRALGHSVEGMASAVCSPPSHPPPQPTHLVSHLQCEMRRRASELLIQRGVQLKADVAPRGRAETHPGQAARRTFFPRRADALLPPDLGHVDGGARRERGEREPRAASLADRDAGPDAALGLVAGYAVADGELGGVLFVEDDVTGKAVSDWRTENVVVVFFWGGGGMCGRREWLTLPGPSTGRLSLHLG